MTLPGASALDDAGVCESYTFVLVRQDPSKPICATGAVWTNGDQAVVPGPIC